MNKQFELLEKKTKSSSSAHALVADGGRGGGGGRGRAGGKRGGKGGGRGGRADNNGNSSVESRKTANTVLLPGSKSSRPRSHCALTATVDATTPTTAR